MPKAPQISFSGEVVGKGELVLDNKEKFIEHLKSIRGPVTIVVKAKRKVRSSNANAYYWGVVISMIADETGHTPQEVHETCKMLFNQQVIHVQSPVLSRVRKLCKNKGGFIPKYLRAKVWRLILDVLKLVGVTDKTITIPGSTAVMDSYSFMEYMNRVMAWGAQDLGIVFPSPDEYYE